MPASLNRGAIPGFLLRTARTLCQLTIDELASETGLGVATIKRVEAAPTCLRMTRVNFDRLVAAFSARGVTIEVDPLDQKLSISLRQ